MHIQQKDSGDRICHIKNILKCFVDFNYLPPMVIPIAILLYCGNTKIRQQLNDKFFKISSKDKRKQVLSGAWDITYLSLIRYKELSDSNNTILVTDDDTLSILARAIKAIRCTINQNFIDISSQANKCTAMPNAGLTQYCDSEALNDFRDVYNDLLANRAHGSPCFPDKKTMLSVVYGFENDLGIDHLNFDVDPSFTEPTSLEFHHGIDLVKERILRQQEVSLDCLKDFSIYCMVMNLLLRDFTYSANEKSKKAVIDNINNAQDLNDCITILQANFQRYPYSFASKMESLYFHKRAKTISFYLDFIFVSWSSIRPTDDTVENLILKILNDLESKIPD